MRWLDEVRRLSALKGQQAGRARKAAAEHRRAEGELRSAAELARTAGQQALEAAALAPEMGLSRHDLYERLRRLALARIHVAETALEASRLDEQAAQRADQAKQARVDSQRLERKQRKLDHWLKQQRRANLTRRHRRMQAQTQEEYVCRLSRP